ncbi:MAG: CocE/NonD family hydrolase [Acidobacteriaceae bacterium]
MPKRTRTLLFALATLALTTAGLSLAQTATQTAPQRSTPVFKYQQVMVPVRDGIHLQTVIFTPVNQQGPLPILLQRTPYGVPDKAPDKIPGSLKEFAQDGYIFVFQNLRGRFKSEGTFGLSFQTDLANPKATSETTDAYDTISWLVKNVPENNGKVGIWGVSYPGVVAAMTLLEPNPALKAVSEQAAPADQWMNDDMHRYGALRESYALEYSVMEQADKNSNTHFNFDDYDTYEWYLKLGPLENVNEKYLHGSIPYWNDMMKHPNYDAFWKAEAWVNKLHSAPVPNLNVAGWWDQEDPWGPWKIFRSSEESDPQHNNYMVAGPWYHGGWQGPDGSTLGIVPFAGHKTSVEFREQIEAPFFRHYLHGEGEKFPWKASTFETGSNTWKTYSAWPPKESKPTNLYLGADGTLSFDAPKQAGSGNEYVQYLSDPAKPVPYRTRPISPTYPGGDWRTWEVADQRFVEGRPDVATFVSQPLDHDITITGALAADLFASTSGTDSDFVVKLIDVYPENAQKDAWDAEAGPKPGQYAQSMNGYELPIAMEVRRGRFNQSYEQPQALVANQVTEFAIPLRDHDHVFLKGHKIMVQVQSTWFPIIDRNPQTFTPSINDAKATDYVPATQRIYCSPQQASHIVLPVMP